MYKRFEKPDEIDIIIISYAKTTELKNETIKGLKSLFKSENSTIIKFNVVVVESNKDIKYDLPTCGHSLKIIYPVVEFGYHTYLNIGLKEGNAEWTCLCNNDLYFSVGWASNILKTIKIQRSLDENKSLEYVSASPCNPREDWHKGMIDKLEIGYVVRKHVAGWCLFQSRNVFDKIGKLEERIKFWFCDNWYSVAMQHNKIPHIFVGTSIVEHHNNLEGTTTKDTGMNKDEKHAITYGAGDEFREIVREMLGNPDWGKTTEEQRKKFEKKTGRKYY